MDSIVVADANLGVLRINYATGTYEHITTNDESNYLAGLVLARDSGDPIFTDQRARAVVRVDRHTGEKRTITHEGNLSLPCGVINGPGAYVIVADYARKVVKIHLDGRKDNQEILASGSPFGAPVGLAMLDDRLLLVADRGSPGAERRPECDQARTDHYDASLDECGKLVRVDLDTGVTKVVAIGGELAHSEGSSLWEPHPDCR